MRVRYIPAVITLIAGTITSIISIIWQYHIIDSLILLLAVLIIFYIIGNIARNIIVYAMGMVTEEDSDREEEIEEESNEQEPNEEQAESIQEQ